MLEGRMQNKVWRMWYCAHTVGFVAQGALVRGYFGVILGLYRGYIRVIVEVI